jgi:hypothetical protein
MRVVALMSMMGQSLAIKNRHMWSVYELHMIQMNYASVRERKERSENVH